MFSKLLISVFWNTLWEMLSFFSVPDSPFSMIVKLNWDKNSGFGELFQHRILSLVCPNGK